MEHHIGTVNLYSPLDESKREIRLVYFEGASGDGDISCKLFTVCLSQAHDTNLAYVALSYLWGDPKQTEGIVIDGQAFKATRNLVSFFRHYEHIPVEYHGLPLWIDAICINQADVTERTSQVKLMGSIYGKATASISWLGLQSEDSHLGMSTISLCARYIRQSAGNDLTDWLEHEKDLLGRVDLEPVEGEGVPRNKAWAAVARVLTRSYWTRVWIYQEIVLPVRIVLLCGAEILPLDDLLRFIEWMGIINLKFECPHVDQNVFPIVLWPQWLSAMGIGRLRKHASNRKRQQAKSSLYQQVSDGLAEMLPVGLRASDPRDIVYGVLGALPIPIIPDYGKSAQDVFVEFAAYLVAEGHLSSVLSQRSSSEKRSRKTGDKTALQLPSWIPDFGLYGFRGLSSSRPFVHSDALDLAVETGCDGEIGVLKPKSRRANLFVSGVICEQIMDEPQLFQYETAFQNIERYLPGENDEGMKTYPSGIPIHQALVRILLKDPGILRDDNDSNKTDKDMLFGFGLAVFESLLHPEHSKEELFKFWRRIGFIHEVPTREELQVMLFGRRIDNAMGVINYRKDEERYRANRRTVMFQQASWDGEYMFQTENGYIGLSEGEVKSGDRVCVLFGCREPVILRPADGYYQFVGTCYVLGYMEGEAVRQAEDGTRTVVVLNIQ